MASKPTYEELEQRIRDLDKESIKGKLAEEAFREGEEVLRMFQNINRRTGSRSSWSPTTPM